MNPNIYHAYMCVLKHQEKMSEDLVDAIKDGNKTTVSYSPLLYYYHNHPFVAMLNKPKKK